MPFSVLSARVLCVRPIGVTSDYCPVCRQERRFHLAQAERKRYFLCFDQGREGQPHHELTCFVCACKVERPVEERPIKILPDPKSASTYEPESLPIVKFRIADCLAMEEALIGGRIKGDDREEMIRYTVFGFARIYDEEPFERVKPWVMMCMLMTIISVALVGMWSMGRSGSVMPVVFSIIAITIVIFTMLYWVTKHSPRKRVRSWLAVALLPIDPSISEIDQACREMQASRIKAGDCICSKRVIAQIAKLKPKNPYGAVTSLQYEHG